MHLHPSTRWLGGLIACAALALPAPASALSPGDLVVADYTGDSLTVVNPVTGARSNLSSNTAPAGAPAFGAPAEVAFEADGNLVVADEGVGVIRVNATTGARTLVSANGSPSGGPAFAQPDGIAVEAGGSILVVDSDAFGGSGGVIRVDPVTGARTAVSSNSTPAGAPSFDEPFGIDLEADGDIVVANTSANEVIRVDPLTGVRTLISSNGAPAGPPLLDAPIDIEIDAGGSILVPDQSGPDVLRVDPVSGARTTVSANAAPAGLPAFDGPAGVAVEPSGRIVVADEGAFAGASGLIGVNPVTGARTTISENAAPPGNPPFVSIVRVAVVPAATDYATTVLADHPHGYWRFGEPSGTALLDSSGNANNGTYLGGVALGATGIPGALPNTAATYDGINDTSRVPDSASLDVGSSFSVEGWIKRTATTKSQELFNKGANGIQLTVMSAGSGNQVWLRKAGVTTMARSAGGILADGAYHHVVATMNGAGTAKIYIDGVLDTVSVSAVQAISDTAFPLTFGIAASNPTVYDEFALYDDPLSAGAVAAHHSAGA